MAHQLTRVITRQEIYIEQLEAQVVKMHEENEELQRKIARLELKAHEERHAGQEAMEQENAAEELGVTSGSKKAAARAASTMRKREGEAAEAFKDVRQNGSTG